MSSDVEALLADSAGSLFARHSDRQTVLELASGDWSPALWSVAEAAELPLVAVSEAHGGSGGTPGHWAVVLRAAGRQCAPIPLAETGVAGWLLEQAGTSVPSGPLTFAEASKGEAVAVPYARHASGVAVLDANGAVSLVPRDRYEIVEAAENLAGEPRDTIRFDRSELGRARAAGAGARDGLRLRMAFARSVQMAGALDALLELTTEHARERVQFGTAIARLPVVRERLVLLAEEVAAAGAAADCATEGLASESTLAVGAAKLRIGEAAGAAARLAHQVHGAIGTTREHSLHLITRRLWAWREEAGNERWWSERIGRMLVDEGADGLWPALAGTGTAAGGEA